VPAVVNVAAEVNAAGVEKDTDAGAQPLRRTHVRPDEVVERTSRQVPNATAPLIDARAGACCQPVETIGQRQSDPALDPSKLHVSMVRLVHELEVSRSGDHSGNEGVECVIALDAPFVNVRCDLDPSSRSLQE